MYFFNDVSSSVAHMFCRTNPTINLTPPDSRSSSPAMESFNPAYPDINPSNSVLMHIDEIPKYLDNALLALGLHTEARTSFITYVYYLKRRTSTLILKCTYTSNHFIRYWLSDILKHTNIALRFLPQSAYEEAAPLNITPKPISVVRIFMLWKGVATDKVGQWQEAIDRFHYMTVDEWCNVVGVPSTFHARSNTGLTVLEWGGMEFDA